MGVCMCVCASEHGCTRCVCVCVCVSACVCRKDSTARGSEKGSIGHVMRGGITLPALQVAAA